MGLVFFKKPTTTEISFEAIIDDDRKEILFRFNDGYTMYKFVDFLKRIGVLK